MNLQIPVWIHNDAKWWSEGVISDTTFAQGIEYLVQEKVIVLPQNTSDSSGTEGQGIPAWVK
ncbi:MAG: peptidase, partial [Candidatus Dormibacteria bacterium]